MQSSGNGERSIHFGSYELRLSSGELLREGTPIKLPPQPYKVLVLLAERAGALVTREEIQQRIWGDGTFVDFDKGLNFCIKQIREALGDSAQSPRFIETLPRRGYRFIATVDDTSIFDPSGTALPESAQARNIESTEPEPAAQAESSPAQHAPAQTAARGKRLFGWPVAIALTAILALLILLVWQRAAHKTAPPAGKVMLAVLPFEDLGGDPAQDYFSIGLTEEMIAQLGRLRPDRLGVIARTTALTYRNSNKDIRRIGEELGVGYVLEGSVRREGSRLRITAQLIQVSDQTHLWSETYERGEGDLLVIQNEVAGRVARSLALELLPSPPSSSVASRTSRPEAYDAYLKARYLIYKDTVEDFERSIPYFEQAIEIDPNFAPAYAGVTEAQVMLATWQNIPAGQVLPKAKAYAEKAVELDPSLAESYAALGSVNFWLEWNWREAEANIKRAIELNPSQPNTRLLYANYLLTQGGTEAGVEEVKQALQLDPVSLLTTGLSAYFYLRAHLFDDAIAQARRMLELEPASPAGHECLVSAYKYKGMYEEARDVLRKRMPQSGAERALIQELNRGDARQGISGVNRFRLVKMKEALTKGQRVTALNMAGTYLEVGDKDDAFEWLEKAYAAREPMLVFFKVHPRYDGLHSDPRFADLGARMGLMP